MRKYDGDTFQYPPKEETFCCDKYEEIKPPEYKIPAGAMPQSRQEPDKKEVGNGAGNTVAVAAQRDVDIIAEEGAKGDMPTAPEFGY